MTFLNIIKFIASRSALKTKTNQLNANQLKAVAKHQTLHYVKYLNHSFAKIYCMFKHYKILGFGLLQHTQLNDKYQLSFQCKSNYDPKTYYKILHWSILEMNSGRDINTTKVRNKTTMGNRLGFAPINRFSATPFLNRSIIYEEDY